MFEQQPPPADITAEWTVHAQLTISRSGGGGGDQPKHSERVWFEEPTKEDINETSGKPVRVVYKWSSDDLKAAGCHRQNSCGAHDRKKPISSELTASCCRNRAVSSEPAFRPQCRSTCNIVLTACTDLYPTMQPGGGGDEADVPTYNTTATCTVLPSTSEDVPPSDATARFLSVKDAFSQTSDPESKADEHNTNQQQQHRSRSRRAYDYRRVTTEALSSSQQQQLYPSPNFLSPNISFDEGTTASPVWRHSSHSPMQVRQASPHSATKKPASTKADPNAKKSPRTVHIDVYCTGSEADEDDESFSTDSISPSTSQSSLDLVHQRAEATHSHHQRSTSSQRNQPFANDDDEGGSNSTPQTVFNATQMRLHHSRRNSRQTLPRRIVNQMMLLDQAAMALPTQPGRLRQYILDQANEKDEINVSKMMLFDKHMGDVKTTKPMAVESVGTSQKATDVVSSPGSARKFSFARYATAAPEPANSDIDFSSAYPNSSRSTFRDPTWSSLSSAMASSSAVFEDLESFGPMPVPSSNLSTADSFEYENHVDRARIREMEQVWMDSTGGGKGWRSPEKERKFMLQQKRMGMMQHEGRPMAELTEDSEEWVVKQPEKPMKTMKAGSMDVNRFYMRQNAIDTDTPVTPVTPEDQLPQRQSLRPPRKLLLDAASAYDNHPATMSTRFGERLEMTRKRHFGPAKNPDCPCDHCRLYAAERKAAKQVRGRALSMGDETMAAALRSTAFWASRHQIE